MRRLSLLGLLVVLLASLYVVPAARAAESPLIPLPGSCIGGLPLGQGAGACCMFGYVIVDGKPVAGANVQITNQRGDMIDVWTETDTTGTAPYYRVSLKAAPLNVVAGETISISVTYSGHETPTVRQHKVIADSQQVDVVLPKRGALDYTFERQIWQQAPSQTFNFYRSELAIDGADLVYIADWVNARIQVFTSAGVFVRQWGTLGSQTGQFLNPSGVAVDPRGFVYVADSGTQFIDKFTNTGEWLARWGGSGTANGEFSFPRDLVSDGTFVYITDSGNNRVQQFTSAGAFVASWGSTGSGNLQFRSPEGIALGPDGLLYVTDADNSRIQVLTRNGGFVRSWGSAGSGNGGFNRPERVAVSADGRVYVADTDHVASAGNDRVQVFSPTGTYLSQWGSFGSNDGEFGHPGGIAFDTKGQVFVTDSFNHRVQIFQPNGSFVKKWGSKGSADRAYLPNGLTTDSQNNLYVADSGEVKVFNTASAITARLGTGLLSNPGGLARDAAGNIYVADTGSQQIIVLNAAGGVVRSWGRNGDADGEFRQPIGVALDQAGAVYVIDRGNNRLQKFTANGQFIWKVGGVASGTGDGQFDFPRGVAIGPGNTVYVADTDNSRVQQFNAAGAFVRKWSGPSGDTMLYPSGIAVDGAGTVYIADFGRYRLQRYSAIGDFLGNFGSAGNGVGEFNQPTRLAVGNDGTLHVAELYVGRIQSFRSLGASRPHVTVTAAAPRVITDNKPVDVLGVGQVAVEGRTISSYQWTIDGTPKAATADASLPTQGLAVGQHRVGLQVRDSAGELSDQVGFTLTVASSTNATRTWTFLLYLAGDVGDLANRFDTNSELGALYRLINTNGPTNVTVVAQYDGDNVGDSTRTILRQGQTAAVTELGEADMSSPQTLVDFVRWGQQQAPADSYYLAIADHGNAIDGIAWDFTTAPNQRARLTNTGLRQALAIITDNGARPIDILHLDACLMGTLETAYQYRDMAQYLIASENLGWSVFAYEKYRALVQPQSSPRDLAAAITTQYATEVERYGALPYTIAALDLGSATTVAQAADSFGRELVRYAYIGQANRDKLATLRTQVQMLDSNGDHKITATDEYVDLDHWAELVQGGIDDQAVKAAAGLLRQSLTTLKIAERHASGIMEGVPIGLANARGLAIYYPSEPGTATLRNYKIDLLFGGETSWTGFLQAGLTPTSPTAEAVPNPIAPVAPPAPPAPGYKMYLPSILR